MKSFLQSPKERILGFILRTVVWFHIAVLVSWFLQIWYTEELTVFFDGSLLPALGTSLLLGSLHTYWDENRLQKN